jgi:cytidyltransferase-like protein
MKAIGIVVEYNPFHNGHRYHLEEAKKRGEIIIAVMSGDFVQRGEPALINKWKRAEMALENGVDIVVELPVFYSTQNAEIFAKGSVKILEHLKVSEIVFGSENGNREFLEEIASFEENFEFKEKIKKWLGDGYSYPTAHAKASIEVFGEGKELNPNDILGVEYIKAIKHWNAPIEPYPIVRIAKGYHSIEIEGDIASATAIRKNLEKNIAQILNVVPEKSLKILIEEYERGALISLADFYPLLRYEILRNYKNLKNIQDMEIGFENKLFECSLNNSNFEDFYSEALSKRFTRGRFQRILIHILLGITKEITEETKKNVPYIRVLGFNKKGRKYLKNINEEIEIPILTSFKNIRKKLTEEQKKLLEFNELGSEIYSMINPYENTSLAIRRENE